MGKIVGFATLLVVAMMLSACSNMTQYEKHVQD